MNTTAPSDEIEDNDDNEFENYEGEEGEEMEQNNEEIIDNEPADIPQNPTKANNLDNASYRKSESSKKERVYQSESKKTIFTAGNTAITMIDAKLYGLLDENGKVRIRKNVVSEEEKLKALQKVKEMSQPKPTNGDELLQPEDEKECRFKPVRSSEAEKAMRNPRCGYDFVTRLGDRGDFLERVFTKSDNSKAKERQLEQEKEDYDAKHDKLQCPICHKEQSFDEFIERRRKCGQCKERYIQGNVANRTAWNQKQKENEERRQQKLKQLEEDAYGNQFQPKLAIKENNTFKITDPEKIVSIAEKTAKALQVKNEQALKERIERETKEKERLQQKKLNEKLRIEMLKKKPTAAATTTLPPPPAYDTIVMNPAQPKVLQEALSSKNQPAKPQSRSEEKQSNQMKSTAKRPASAGVKGTGKSKPTVTSKASKDDIFKQFQQLVEF